MSQMSADLEITLALSETSAEIGNWLSDTEKVGELAVQEYGAKLGSNVHPWGLLPSFAVVSVLVGM